MLQVELLKMQRQLIKDGGCLLVVLEGRDAVAILIAASSNNVIKAIYTVSLGGWRTGRLPFVALIPLAAAGIGVAFVM